MSLTIQQGLQKVAGEPYQHPRKGVECEPYNEEADCLCAKALPTHFFVGKAIVG